MEISEKYVIYEGTGDPHKATCYSSGMSVMSCSRVGRYRSIVGGSDYLTVTS